MTDSWPPQINRALLLIVSGPAGSGKTTVCQRLVNGFQPRLERVVTATTRPPRTGEQSGVDYHFLDEATFTAKIKGGEFYEWAKVHDWHYGSWKSVIQLKLARKVDLIMAIDVQGAAAFRQTAKTDRLLQGRLVTVFIMPADMAQLRQRLQGRGDDPSDVARRIRTAEAEIVEWRHFDYCITSASRDEDYTRLAAIYQAEKLKITPTPAR